MVYPVTFGNMKERIAWQILHIVRSRGHPYVDIWDNWKRLVFCDTSLHAHLNGKRHAASLATARVALLKPNPRPFDDGAFIFHHKHKYKLPDMEPAPSSSGSNTDVDDGAGRQLVIPYVTLKEKTSDLVVRHIGVGKISARLIEIDGVSDIVRRIWCEWLGDKENTSGLIEHDFAVVTFPCIYKYLVRAPRGMEKTKGKKETGDQSGFCRTGDQSVCSRGINKKKISFSDPGFGDDQPVSVQTISRKNKRRRLMSWIMVSSFPEYNCGICLYKMLPNKHVAALLNRKTGELTCSSRNPTGCKYAKLPEGKEHEEEHIPSLFCPNCWDEFEKPAPSFPFSQKIKYRDNIHDAHNAWIKSPELTEKCSIGLDFPRERESVVPLKRLHFYRADV